MNRPLSLLSAALAAVLLLPRPAVSADAAKPSEPRLSFPITWCSLGTSITWYNDHVSPKFTKGYQTRVMERIRFDGFVNRGVNGGRIASAIGQVVPANVYTIEHGVNDWGGRTAPGSMADYENDTGAGTFAGAYRKLIDKIRATNPKAAIILCTPRKAYGFGTYLPPRCDARQPNGYYLKDYADLVRAIAEKEGFQVADFYAECGEQDELASLSIDVALHPNDDGYQRMADTLFNALRRRFPNAKPLAKDDGQLHGDAEMIPIPDDTSIVPGALSYAPFLRPEARLVFKDVRLAEVEPSAAEMAGVWIPGSPYKTEVKFVRRSEDGSRLVCQFQVRPPDACLRSVAVEFRQRGKDVTAKILWARYILNGPKPGVDFDAPGYGGAPIATSPAAYGYGICNLVFVRKQRAHAK